MSPAEKHWGKFSISIPALRIRGTDCGSIPVQEEQKKMTLAMERAWLGLPGKVLKPLWVSWGWNSSDISLKFFHLEICHFLCFPLGLGHGGAALSSLFPEDRTEQ